MNALNSPFGLKVIIAIPPSTRTGGHIVTVPIEIPLTVTLPNVNTLLFHIVDTSYCPKYVQT